MASKQQKSPVQGLEEVVQPYRSWGKWAVGNRPIGTLESWEEMAKRGIWLAVDSDPE